MRREAQEKYPQGENDRVASVKHFVVASTNQNRRGDNFTCYGDNCNCGNNSYCFRNK